MERFLLLEEGGMAGVRRWEVLSFQGGKGMISGPR